MFGRNGGGSKSSREFQEPAEHRVTVPIKPSAVQPIEPVETRLDKVVIRGEFAISETGEIFVEGALKGNIDCHVLSVGETGSMTGDIEADRVHIAGMFNGNIKAKTLVMTDTARVKTQEATVFDSITIEPNAQFEGTLSRPGPQAREAKAREKEKDTPKRKAASEPAAASGGGAEESQPAAE
jgi:cytoskeletal protein CcmA (bactofilin family)